MENLVQKSVKMDPHAVEGIQKIADDQRYWKFNSVVNSLLVFVLDGLDRKDLLDVMRYSPRFSNKKPKITIEWVDK